jgi:hypothetical protein
MVFSRASSPNSDNGADTVREEKERMVPQRRTLQSQYSHVFDQSFAERVAVRPDDQASWHSTRCTQSPSGLRRWKTLFADFKAGTTNTGGISPPAAVMSCNSVKCSNFLCPSH